MSDTVDTDTATITEQDGTVVGPLRRSVNAARDAKGSIHDDATASRLGFRGGTVAGSVHLDLFPPVLMHAFGQRWFETGSISMNFKNATTDRESVRAFVRRPDREDDVVVEAWIERDDGMRVGEGSASVGSSAPPSVLRSLDLQRYSDEELRMLADVDSGMSLGEARSVLDGDRQQNMLERRIVTEPLPWYEGHSPWGGPVALPQVAVGYLYRHGVAGLGRAVGGRGGAVGLFGAIELAYLNGPLLLEREYDLSGQVLAVGQSPKTEYAWFEVTAADGGDAVASMLMQLRWMKASSPLYTDADETA